MKMKKALCIALALVLAIGMLAGCGGTTEDTAADISAFVDTDEKLEISWFSYPGFTSGSEGKPSELLLEKEFNVEIKPIFSDWAGVTDKKNALLQSGDIPDLIYEMDPMFVFADARDEFLFEVPYEAIEKYAPELYGYINENAPAAWAYTYYDGKNYGMPNLENIHEETNVAIYRGDWLEKVGKEVPTTLDELHDVFYAFTYEDPDGNGKDDTYGYISYAGPYFAYFTEIFGAYDVLPFDWQEVDGEIVYGGLRPETETVLALLKEWNDEGIIYPAFAEGDKQAWALFKAGQIGYDIETSYDDPNLETGLLNTVKAKEPNAKLAYGSLVKGPNGDYGSRKWGYACHAVCFGANGDETPVKVTRILKMLEKMFTDRDFNAKVRLGEEGVTYKLDKASTGKTSIVNIGEYADNAFRGRECYTNSMSGPSYWSPIAPKRDDYYYYLSDAYLAFKEEYQDYDANLEDVFYKVDIVPSAPTYIVDIQNQQMALMSKVIKGEVPADQYIEEFTKIWEGTGGPQMLEEARAQNDILDEIYTKIGIK